MSAQDLLTLIQWVGACCCLIGGLFIIVLMTAIAGQAMNSAIKELRAKADLIEALREWREAHPEKARRYPHRGEKA